MASKLGTPWSISLRKWQLQGLDVFWECKAAGADFTCVATPAAGKTVLGVKLAHEGLLRDEYDLVVFVAPTCNVRNEWVNKAHKAKMELLGDEWQAAKAPLSGYAIGSQYCGVAVTYQSVFQNKEHLRNLVAKAGRVLVVLDEIHHAGDEKGWGEALLYAFGEAETRVMLSGTPWRGDTTKIPFVRYEWDEAVKDKVLVADYTYGYADALADGIVRELEFPSFDGKMDWLFKDKRMSVSFLDALAEEQVRQRLNTALMMKRTSLTSWEESWLTYVLFQAKKRNDQIRATEDPMVIESAVQKKPRVYGKAAVLVLARDIKHAVEIRDFIHHVLKQRVTLVTSDDPTSQQLIDDFKKNEDEWIVSVRMISEGVDIVRIRSVVFATNVLTEMFFRQAAGRALRKLVPNWGTEAAYMYIPAEPILMGYARAFAEAKLHALKIRDQRPPPPTPPPPGPGGTPPSSYFPLASAAIEGDVVNLGEHFSATEYEVAEQLRSEFPMLPPGAPVTHIIRMLRRAEALKAVTPPPPSPPTRSWEDGDRPLQTVQAGKRGDVETQVRRLASAMIKRDGASQKEIGTYCAQIRMTMQRMGWPMARDSEETVESLEAMMLWLNGQISKVNEEHATAPSPWQKKPAPEPEYPF